MAKKQPKQDLVCVIPSDSRDVATIHRIDEECFEQQAKSRKWFGNILLTEEDVAICYIAKVVNTGKVVGYILAEQQPGGILIRRIAVLPMYRRKGYGRLMFSQLMLEKPDGVGPFTVNVPEGCLNGQLFFKSLGFFCIKTKKQFFRDTGEDAYVFEFLEGVSHDI